MSPDIVEYLIESAADAVDELRAVIRLVRTLDDHIAQSFSQVEPSANSISRFIKLMVEGASNEKRKCFLFSFQTLTKSR